VHTPEVLDGSALTLVENPAALPRLDGALIGIAFYSLPDLKLVDTLVRRSRETDNLPGQIEVFDILIYKSKRDLERILPGMEPLYGTPIVGIWKNGALIQKGSGAEGRRIISQYYGIGQP
jgi:hypothetical protein